MGSLRIIKGCPLQLFMIKLARLQIRLQLHKSKLKMQILQSHPVQHTSVVAVESYKTTQNYRAQKKARDNAVYSGMIIKEIETLIKKLRDTVDKVDSEDDIYSVLWDFGGELVSPSTLSDLKGTLPFGL